MSDGVSFSFRDRNEAGIEMDGNFLIRHIYPDQLTFRLVAAAEKILGLELPVILELFGGYFYDFCIESGYEPLLRVLGSTPIAFLENLDALHDHLASVYPGMRAPSFHCTKLDHKSTILHYYSERDGFEPIVIGIVNELFRKLLKRDISVTLRSLKQPDVSGRDHSQFLIEEHDTGDICGSSRDLDEALDLFDPAAKISPATFTNLFPFHLTIDRDLCVRSVGSSLSRVIPQLACPSCRLNDVFAMLRPHVTFDFNSITSHLMTVFVLKTVKKPLESADSELVRLKLKGQMIYLPENGWMLFVCSPIASSISDLSNSSLFLSDIPVHDATKDLVVISEQFAEDYDLVRDLEVLTDQLQQSFRNLEAEKTKTDRLLYSILPASVAIKLRNNRPVPATKYDNVTVLFCGVTNFAKFCNKHLQEPFKIVAMLNDIFTTFDALTDPKLNPHVFKVLTRDVQERLRSNQPKLIKIPKPPFDLE